MKHAQTAGGIAAHASGIHAETACAPEQKHARTALMIAGSAAMETCAAMRPALLRKIVGTVRRIADRAVEMSAEMMPVRAQRIAPHAAPIAAAAVRIPRRTAAIVCAMRTKPATPASRIAGRAWLLFAAMQSATVRKPAPPVRRIAEHVPLRCAAAMVPATTVKRAEAVRPTAVPACRTTDAAMHAAQA